MVWTYLAESVDSVTPWQIGSDQLPIVKSKDTQEVCSYHACLRASCQSHQSGMTSKLCTDECCLVLTSYTGDSPVRILVLQDLEKAWKESEADYFSRSCGLLASYDHHSFSWKTCQQSLVEDLEKLPQKLPKQGLIVDGQLYPLRKLERITDAKDGGYLPTPTVCGNYNKKGSSKNSGNGLATYVKMFPTPPASDATTGAIIGKNDTFKVLPSGNMRKFNKNGTNGSLGLARHVQFFPTPDASARGARKNQNGHQYTLQDAVGGQLNPTWVEWLMGYPTGWTELKDSVMQWFLSVQKKRLKN